jgi:hypothetical protein
LNSDAMSPNLDAEWAKAIDEPLSANEEAEVDCLVDNLPADTYATGRQAKRPTVRQGSVPAGKRVAVAFTNVTWDLATAGRDVGFTGVWDWLRETISTIAGLPDAHLIVRAHPAEGAYPTGQRILDQVRTQWPAGVPNVTLIDPEDDITADELCGFADLVLAYNSTAALEAVIRGRTAVVCGRPHFRSRGFTIDVSTHDEYRHVLTQWAKGGTVPGPAAARELARRYFHLFFARYHITLGWTTSPLEPPYRLLVKSIDELAPGRNAALDVVCAGILEGRQILLPRQREAMCAR